MVDEIRKRPTIEALKRVNKRIRSSPKKKIMEEIIDGDDIVRGLIVCTQSLLGYANGSFRDAERPGNDHKCEGCDERVVYGPARFCRECTVEIATELLAQIPEARKR